MFQMKGFIWILLCNHHVSYYLSVLFMLDFIFGQLVFLSLFDTCIQFHTLSDSLKHINTTRYVSTSVMIYLIKSNHPKDGRKAEWIFPCCVPGVSSSVVSLPPHRHVAIQSLIISKPLTRWNESMCVQLPFDFCFIIFILFHLLFTMNIYVQSSVHRLLICEQAVWAQTDQSRPDQSTSSTDVHQHAAKWMKTVYHKYWDQ